MKDSIETLYREPFSLGSPEQVFFEPGVSLGEIAGRLKCLPSDFEKNGRIFIEDNEIPRELWHCVKPKHSMTVTFHGFVQGGGGGDSSKGVFGIIAALALTVFTAGVAGGLLAPVLGSGFAAGTFGASALAAGIGLVGQLAIQALTAPPAAEASPEKSGGIELEPSSITGNVLASNAPVPRVIGKRRIFPAFAFEPIVEMVGQDQIVEAAYCLAGPHKLTNVQLGGVSVDSSSNESDLTIETREGLPGDANLSLTQRQGRTSDLQIEMSKHGTNEENQAQWDGSTLPVWHGFNTRLDPDEIWLHFQLNGLQSGNLDTEKLRIPIRIRMRRRGETDWRNLPELHYMNVTQSQIRFQVKIYFGDPLTSGLPQPSSNYGFVEARKLSPGQDVSPAGSDWEADEYFSDGAGDDVYRSGTQSSTNMLNLTLGSPNKVEIYLDRDEWPSGVYDVEVIRGNAFKNSDYNSANYTIGGDVIDLFGYRSTNALPLTHDQLLDGLYLIRGVSIWNEYPVNQGGLSLISLKATNRKVDKLSVEAAGYVRDYGGYEDPGATTNTVSPSTEISDGTHDKSDDIAFECQIVLPKEPTNYATIWNEGGSTTGAGLYILDGYLVLRVGTGSSGVQETDDNTAVLKIAITSLPFDGELHTVAWDIEKATRTVRLWIDQAFIGEESANTSGHGNWAGSSVGGYLIKGTNDVAGIGSNAVAWDDATGATDLSVWDGGNLHDESGEGWNVFNVTSNPAPHFRDVTSGTLNFDPLPENLLDDANILSWRDACYRNDYVCDIIAEGTRVQDLRNLIASCGFARPYQSEIWGVIRDYDRSAESPVQIFSPRNSNELNWKKAFPRLPTGFRVNYKNNDAEQTDAQIVVYRAGAEGNATRLEQVTYDGIIRETKAIERAEFDLDQGRLRSTIYSMKTPIESIVCRRGSLVGVNHDILMTQYGSARIYSTTVESGDVTEILLDSQVQLYNETDMLSLADILGVGDMHTIGLKSGVTIRHTDGTLSTHELDCETGETDTLTLSTPVANDTVSAGPFDSGAVPLIDYECLVVVGTIGKEYKRLIVTEIAPQDDLVATLTLVDEAPELWS